MARDMAKVAAAVRVKHILAAGLHAVGISAYTLAVKQNGTVALKLHDASARGQWRMRARWSNAFGWAWQSEKFHGGRWVKVGIDSIGDYATLAVLMSVAQVKLEAAIKRATVGG